LAAETAAFAVARATESDYTLKESSEDSCDEALKKAFVSARLSQQNKFLEIVG
jgi:hypothetical protein